jgi:hypothetical protein
MAESVFPNPVVSLANGGEGCAFRRSYVGADPHSAEKFNLAILSSFVSPSEITSVISPNFARYR